MQITETLSEGLKRELKVVVAANELDERMNAKLDELKDKVRLKGFRPGKVPVAHIRKVYGQSVMAEVLQEAVEESRVKAFSERDERPAIQPNISLMEDESAVERVMQGGHDLEFTMSFEVLPKIELADLKKIEVERPVADVAEEAVDNALKRLLEANKVYDPKDGPAENGDRLILNFVGKIDGEPFEGGSAEGAQVILGDGMFIPGFEDGLAGAKTGESRTVNVTFPDDYQAAHLAGKAAEFDVTVTEVAAPRLPEANDEFAKGVGVESLSKLKDALRERIEKEYARISRAKAKRSLFDALDKAHGFELPPSLVEKEFEAIWQQMTTQMQRAKRTFEDEGTTEEKSREEYRAMAERRVRLGLVISEIGQRNEISVSDEELRRAIMQRAQQYPGQERQVIEFFKDNPNAVLEMRMPLFEEKVVDFTLELADVSEKKVSPEELFEPDEEDFVPMHDDDHDHDHECGPDCGHDHHHHDHDHAHSRQAHGEEHASEHKDK